MPQNLINPDNYTWLKVGDRIVCRDKNTGDMLFNSHMPVTMRQALLMGYHIGWDLNESQNQHYIGWLEGLIEQFKPEVLPMSDNEYYEMLSQIEGQPLMDMGLQDVLNDMDEQAKEQWELEKQQRDKEVAESWDSVETEAMKSPDYYTGSKKKAQRK